MATTKTNDCTTEVISSSPRDKSLPLALKPLIPPIKITCTNFNGARNYQLASPSYTEIPIQIIDLTGNDDEDEDEDDDNILDMVEKFSDNHNLFKTSSPVVKSFFDKSYMLSSNLFNASSSTPVKSPLPSLTPNFSPASISRHVLNGFPSNSVKTSKVHKEVDSVITNVGQDHPFYKLLFNWQRQLSKKKNNEGPIFVENLFDDTLPPSSFEYITTSIYRKGVPPESSLALIGCMCSDCKTSRNCCPHMAGCRPAYTVTGKVKVDKGKPIYECNFMCMCDHSCINRVVQKGRKFPACIFRTPDGRGWGVKTCITLKKGMFVTEYIGEIISSEEAERRGEKYDKEGSTYLFDLDFDEDQSDFTIDAGHYGNISHFFNHSV
jgi:histone-lysine N-methyltransferase SUV39H